MSNKEASTQKLDIFYKHIRTMQFASLAKTSLSNSIHQKKTFDFLETIVPTGHLLSELLPYDPSIKTGQRLKDGLKEYFLLLTATEQAFELLKRGNFHAFDPLVGENACQIRAVKLAVMFSETVLDSQRVLPAVVRAKARIAEYLANISKYMADQVSLQDLLNCADVNVLLDNREIFLIKSYLLSKVKVARPVKEDQPLVKNEYTDTKKIKEIASVGSMFAENLVRFLREKISSRSVDFVQKINGLNDAILSEEFVLNHRGLQCLPCFSVTRALMRYALDKGIPIVLLAEQKAPDQSYTILSKTIVFFHATPKGYLPICPTKLDHEAPALFLIGSSCRPSEEQLDEARWRQELVQLCPMDMILAYAATHRQYPDASQDYKVEVVNDPEYIYYKQKAREWGCSSENPSRFFLAHAFCDKIANARMHF